MKKTLLLLILISILSSLTLVESAGTSNFILQVNATGSTYIQGESYLKTVLVNQNPSPADPGGYVDLSFKIENWGTKNAENVTFELLPKYPFSLDPSVNAIKELGTIRGLQTGDNAFYIKYKVRVDKDAIDGESEIKLRYTYDAGSSYSTETFDIAISNPRTDFEVILQDSTTLAIANTGANTAYSVIVKIPEQENFKVSGTSASIIGNLDAGDYTLASFQITQSNVRGSEKKDIVVEISYTDLLGIRRVIQKEVPFEFASAVETGIRTIRENQTQMFIGSGLLYIVIGIVGIIVIVVIIKFRKRKKK